MTRFASVIATFTAMGAAALVFFHPLPMLIWNTSPSVPIGLYVVHPAGALQIDELVIVRPPNELARFLSARRYLPHGVPMLKRVLALPGQIVCRSEHTITIGGVVMAEALGHDTQGRLLPVWDGCQRIAAGEVFS